VDQATLASFISSGDFYTHLRRCRKTYARRLEVFLTCAASERLPVEFPFADGGMNQTGFFADRSVDAVRISERLATSGFEVPATARYAIRPTPPALVFGFTAFDEQTITKTLPRLARALSPLS
jgi:GntR family transcriptional regulator/MocR family aminotransferase